MFPINVEVIDMCKLLTYTHLDQEKLLPEEQKGCRKGSGGTNDLLYIDRAVIKGGKSRNKNLAMDWIDCKKTYASTFVDYKMFRFAWSSRQY